MNNYSFSTVGPFRPKLPTLFVEKEMTAVGLRLRSTSFSSSRFGGFESQPYQKFLLFIPNFSRYLKLVKNIGVALRKISALWDKKIRRKVLIIPSRPPLSKLFRYPKLIQKWMILLRKFSALGDKIFDENCWNSPPSYPNFLVPEKSETRKGSPEKLFGTVRQIIFDGKSWYSPPLLSKHFRYLKLIKH